MLFFFSELIDKQIIWFTSLIHVTVFVCSHNLKVCIFWKRFFVLANKHWSTLKLFTKEEKFLKWKKCIDTNEYHYSKPVLISQNFNFMIFNHSYFNTTLNLPLYLIMKQCFCFIAESGSSEFRDQSQVCCIFVSRVQKQWFGSITFSPVML